MTTDYLTPILEANGAFFAFSQSQFDEQKKEGVIYVSMGAGLICPKAKAERYQNWANSAEKKSNEYFEASQEGRDFLSLAEPIKVGHHSEKRHRALIERNWNRMGKSVEFSEKAVNHEIKTEYWAK